MVTKPSTDTGHDKKLLNTRSYFALIKPNEYGFHIGYTAWARESNRARSFSEWCDQGYSILSEHYSPDGAKAAIRLWRQTR
jgi:hypothetical protein